MTAPDRIWADQDNLTWVENDPAEAMRDSETEYVRADIVNELAQALERMLSHSCVADAGADMKDAEDHDAERRARAALARYRGGV